MIMNMLVNRLGSPDGISIRSYDKGGTYEMPEALARVFIREGWARPVQESSDRRGETKNKGAAPENKTQRKVAARKVTATSKKRK